MRELTELGLQQKLAPLAVSTREVVFCNRFGQLIYREPRGRFAGYEWPQFSIHRADLHNVLLDAVRERLGVDAVVLGRKCIARGAGRERRDGALRRRHERARQRDRSAATASIPRCGSSSSRTKDRPPTRASTCGAASRARSPILTGASMVIGGLAGSRQDGDLPDPATRSTAKAGSSINWVAEIQSPRNVMQDWNLGGKLEDFYPTFAGWTFDWLDAAALLRNADTVLEYPMVDRDPLPHVVAWPRDAARRRGAPDVSARLERSRAGDSRCARPGRLLQARTGRVRRAASAYEDMRLKPRTKSC